MSAKSGGLSRLVGDGVTIPTVPVGHRQTIISLRSETEKF